MRKILTLCIIHQDNRVLLGMKKRGFGQGKWNGFGGKVMEGEAIEDAAQREVKEEAGIDVTDIQKMGIIDFEFASGLIHEVHIFRTTAFSGEIQETEEMKPQWFLISDIPYTDMWADDIYWLPILLAGKKFKGRFAFGESDTILEQELREVITFIEAV